MVLVLSSNPHTIRLLRLLYAYVKAMTHIETNGIAKTSGFSEKLKVFSKTSIDYANNLSTYQFTIVIRFLSFRNERRPTLKVRKYEFPRKRYKFRMRTLMEVILLSLSGWRFCSIEKIANYQFEY